MKAINNILKIPIDSERQDISLAALTLFESATVISIDEWNLISNYLSDIGISWAPRTIDVCIFEDNIKSFKNQNMFLNIRHRYVQTIKSRVYRRKK